jgi:hypothetical protein
MNFFLKYRIYLFLLVFLTLGACRTAKYIPEGEYLLTKVSVDADNDQIPDKEFEDYIRQKFPDDYLKVIL